MDEMKPRPRAKTFSSSGEFHTRVCQQGHGASTRCWGRRNLGTTQLCRVLPRASRCLNCAASHPADEVTWVDLCSTMEGPTHDALTGPHRRSLNETSDG